MQSRNVLAGVAGSAVVLALGACTSDPDPQSVALLAGGGDGRLDQVTGEGSPGAEIELGGAVTNLTGRGDGTVWGVIGGTGVVAVHSDGSTQQWRITDGRNEPVEIADVAAAPDGTVYIVPASSEVDLLATDPVFRVNDDGAVEPALGATGEYGPITDIAVDGDGRLLFIENVGDADPGASDFQPHQVRRVEADGTVTTLAGADDVSDEGPQSDDYQVWLSLPEGTAAADLPLYRHTGLAAGAGGDVYLVSGESLARVTTDGTVEHLAGAGADGEPLPTDTVFGDPVAAGDLAYAASDPWIGVNGGGDIVTSTALDIDPDDVVPWDVDGGNDATQAVVDGAAETSTVMVTADGDVVLVSMLGTAAAWLDDHTIAVAATDESGRSIVVGIDVP